MTKPELATFVEACVSGTALLWASTLKIDLAPEQLGGLKGAFYGMAMKLRPYGVEFTKEETMSYINEIMEHSWVIE